MATTKRVVPKSRLEGIAAAWDEVLESAAKVEEAQVEYNQKVVAHKKKLREALKEQGAPIGHHINMETGEVYDPAKVSPSMQPR